MESEYKKHESYGVIELSNVSSSQRESLFGSSIKHNQFISLSIKRASIKRELNRSWISSEGTPIIEVLMSYTQFAEAITSFNKGEGKPCTITRIEGKRMQECPNDENKVLQFDKEFENQMKKITSDSSLYYSEINKILDKPNIGKKDREEIKEQIRCLMQEIDSNIPYIKRAFSEQVDKTILEAKGEVEAFIENKIRSVGLEGFKHELLKLNALPTTTTGEANEANEKGNRGTEGKNK